MTERLPLLCAVAALLAGCGGAKATTTPDAATTWKAAPDVLELGRVWHGSHPNCSGVAPEQSPNPPTGDAPNLRRSECVVAHWSSVVLYEDPESPDSRRLVAQADNPMTCDPKRFASRVETVQSMPPSNIVSILVTSPLDGAFAGTRLVAMTHWVAPGGCEIEVTVSPKGDDAVRSR